ncbi:MAG: DUF1501 domain-containing protein [Planctomycetaceae bacterium]|nr:DUF1501 domain-containing protein [Planctomycetaceae bacterium]
MASLQRTSDRFCDGLSRRNLLRAGALAMGGLSLPQLLQAEVGRKSHKSVIMVFLSGGPPHQDMVDLKPEAPVDIRGEFRPIDTCVPGFQVCELLPKLAQRMDRISVIRSLVGSEGRHAAFQCMTGHGVLNQPPGGWPSLGSAVSKLEGPTESGILPFLSLSPRMRNSTWGDPGQAGFAGQAHAPFCPNADPAQISLNGLSLANLQNRQALLQDIDRLQREAYQSGALEGLAKNYQDAFGLLTSNKLLDALDLEQEDPRVRDAYGRGAPENAGYGDAGPLMNDYLLAARRLVEAGVRVVTLAYGRWDWHGRPHGTNFENARDHLPVFDQGITTLLDDLRDRGLDQDVSVVIWGEFGRTPVINKNGGRDHWPQVACALLSGGGMRGGQIIGATNKLGEYPTERPVHFQEVFATLYHNLGINPETTTLPDRGGRPTYLVDPIYAPLPELV